MSDARDPIAEQNEAARRFEERTGRKPTDSTLGVARMRLRPDGSIETTEVEGRIVSIEQTPTAVFGRFPGGTDPRAAVAEVFATMFPGGLPAPLPDPHPDAIDVDVIEDPPEFLHRPDATCLMCRALMKIFKDDKVNPECPRCHGTGDEPETE